MTPDQPTAPSRSADSPMQETMPMRSVPAAVPHYAPPVRSVPPAPAVAARRMPPRPPQRSSAREWRWVMGAGAALLFVLLMGAGAVALLALNTTVLPGVVLGGVRVGGQTIEQVTRLMSAQPATLTLLLDGQAVPVDAAAMGVRVDARTSAERAFDAGRGDGLLGQALLSRVSVPLVVTVDVPAAEAYLVEAAPRLSVEPVNASIAFVDGQVQPRSAQAGSVLDVQATLQRLLADPAAALAEGLALVSVPVPAAISDVTPALEAARALLASPLEISVFDPVTASGVVWRAAPEQWGQWLTAVSDPASPIGLRLTLADAPLRSFLQGQAAIFDPSRTLDMDAAIGQIQAAIASGSAARATVTVKHLPRQYVVQPGDTLTSIAWNIGIPFLYIQQANGGRDRFSAGETITLPPADSFLLLPVVPSKRIVVSISQQRVRVYENGQMLHDWAASTGIASSPTWPGVYQVILRERNAYAGNWDLWMPYFIGVYRPIPGAAFTNGFHGFPTRGGGQVLWENSLGRRVTYGCILISNANAAWLFNWAEEGVVVEIQA